MKSDEWEKIKEVFNAALDLPETERAVFLANCDKDLRLRVEKLLNSDEKAEGFIVEPAFVEVGFSKEDEQDFYVGKQIDAYKILEEIGHGGMGTVYLASRRDDFEKRVALKLIKRGMDTNSVLKRFMLERQILARLEHPNIANLLDGGSTEDGLPFLVMEFVEGLPVTKFCATGALNIGERLELFQKICSAVSYAHQNLIVHRDLKPSNILVTPEGVPKLLDFGIAKLLDPDWLPDTTEATVTMFRIMTPEYASPEQIRGLPITTTSDVYSLGMVLYELLTGERPYKIESRLPEEIGQIILTQEPIRPSSVVSRSSLFEENQTSENKEKRTTDKGQKTNRKSLRGDLDNIILKALSKEPERRYQSVQEFSEDIRRHLSGLPVMAMADTLIYRFNKFAKRHRAGMLAGSLIILTLLLSTTITAWQAYRANQARAKAEQRFNEVRQLANSVIFEYNDGIAKLSGSTSLREKMINDALRYLDNLSAESIEDKDLQLELAHAYEKVGDVQGNPYNSNLGNLEGAQASYRKALTIREKLYQANSSDSQIMFELGTAYAMLGDIDWAKGNNEDALSNYQKGLKVYVELSESDSQNQRYQTGIAYILNGIGHVQTQLGDFKGAFEAYQRGVNINRNILATDPNNKNYQESVAGSILKLGDAFMDNTDYQSALVNYEEAENIWAKLLTADRENAVLLRKLGLVYGRLALTYTSFEQNEKAVNFDLKALEQQKKLAQIDSKDTQIESDIVSSYINIANDFLKLKKLNLAEENIKEAIRECEILTKKNPDFEQVQESYGKAYAIFAQILTEKGDNQNAIRNYQNALTILQADSVRNNASVFLAQTYEEIGDIYQKTNRLQDAVTWYQKSLELLNDLRQHGTISDAGKLDKLAQKIENCKSKLK